MKVINTTAQQAEEALVELAGHVPTHVPIGRPLVALGYGAGAPEILTTTPDGSAALWSLEPGQAVRLVELDGGRAEVARFSRGTEISRALGRTS